MKGPWRYGKAVPHSELFNNQWEISAQGAPNRWKDGEYMSVSGICTEDDARKMAAAPTMLSAIERFEAWWLAEGMYAFEGAPECVFALREAGRLARGGE